MSDQWNKANWLKKVKEQPAELSISDHRIRRRIQLLNLHLFDLQLLRWVRPFLLRLSDEIADATTEFVFDLFKFQSTLLPRSLSTTIRDKNVEITQMFLSGVLDQRFIRSSREQALLCFRYQLDLSNQIALSHGFINCIIEAINRQVNCREQALIISKALEKIVNLNLQLIMENYQQLKDNNDQKKEDAIRFKAYHDPLTGLPNQLVAEEVIEAMIDQRKDHSFSVFKINIDRLKMINEMYGRTIGNKLLIMLSGRINAALEPLAAELYRISSDEFMILFKNRLSRSELIDAAELLTHTSELPFIVDGKEIYATYSIGISRFPQDGANSVQLFGCADAALREAKKDTKESYFFYNTMLHQQLMKKICIEDELQKALYKQQFVLYYQPQVDAGSGALVGVEALLRWEHPIHGILPPSGFIAVAEETGIIREIGWWVLNEACRQMKKWQETGALNVPISVNLSFNQFRDETVVKQVAHALKMSGLAPNRLNLEITESMMAEDLERSVRILNEIRALGVGVSLDDFGTGYSSLSYLKNLPINQLKIDRSFVIDIVRNHRDQAIVAAIVTLAKQLWVDVIVEGIETEEQLRAIEACRCRAIQGYYYSQPLAESDFTEKYLA
ncbi:putative bifunctional diguanylate cyclase/phosphodiesterase [Sporolactobacillus terrae]|uniref:putative bifunctional diguanylate cyclase/phosphodiesterase n=1 Tax=Sporolactobacillus terrae TaxID=269673 RepID=UPI00111AB273|nr:EAL domain-containing protein [Sporolactobacillus terrae]